MVKKITLIYFFLLLSIFLVAAEIPVFTGNLDKASQVTKGKLDEIISPMGDFDYAMLIGADGTAAYIHKKAFPMIKIKKSWGKWKIKAKNLPEVCNISNLSEIALFKADSDYKLTVWDGKEVKPFITPFSAIISEFELLGKSSKNNFSARKYKRNRSLEGQFSEGNFLCLHDKGMENQYSSIDSLTLRNFYFSCNEDTVRHIWLNPPSMDLDRISNSIYTDSSPTFIFHIIGLTQGEWEETLATMEDVLPNQTFETVRLTYPESSNSSKYSMRRTGDYSQLNSIISKSDYRGQIYISDSETMQAAYFKQALTQAREDDINLILSCYELDSSMGKSTFRNKARNLGYLIDKLKKKWPGKIYIFGSKEYDFPYFKEDKMVLEDFLGYWGEIQ